MNRETHPADVFYLQPPWGLLTWVGLFVLLGLGLMWRCSELGGEEIIRACRAAQLIAAAAVGFGLLPTVKSWSGGGFCFLRSVFWGAAVRFVITLAGVVVLLLCTSIKPFWLVIFLGLSYGLFLGAETAVILWMLRSIEWMEDERS